MPVPLKLKVGRQPEQTPEEKSEEKVAPVAVPAPQHTTGWFADASFRSFVIACAISLLVIVVLIAFQLVWQSSLSLHKFGFKFLTTSMWNPVTGEFGALPFICGTLATSILGLLIAVPLSLGTALFLTELCP